jgi:hypothetical protein
LTSHEWGVRIDGVTTTEWEATFLFSSSSSALWPSPQR